MAAMKPRTGDGPLEVTKEGRGIVLRMPLEGGGRLVVEMTPDRPLHCETQLQAATACPDVPPTREASVPTRNGGPLVFSGLAVSA